MLYGNVTCENGHTSLFNEIDKFELEYYCPECGAQVFPHDRLPYDDED